MKAVKWLIRWGWRSACACLWLMVLALIEHDGGRFRAYSVDSIRELRSLGSDLNAAASARKPESPNAEHGTGGLDEACLREQLDVLRHEMESSRQSALLA